MTLIANGGGSPGKGQRQIPFLDAYGKSLQDQVDAAVRERSPELAPKSHDILGALFDQFEKVGWQPEVAIARQNVVLEGLNKAMDAASIAAGPDLLSTVVNIGIAWLQAALLFAADRIAGGLATVASALTPVVASVAKGLVLALERMGLGDLAKNLDTSGDVLAFLGSVNDIVIDERLLTTGALSFKDLLSYENRLSGIRTAVVLLSFMFSIAVEATSFGQMDAFVGLLIHLVDDIVSDASRIVSTQLVRRAVGDPLAEGYKQIHRTIHASTSELEDAYKEGNIDDEDLVRELATSGYTDAAIQTKVELARSRRLYTVGLQPSRTRPAAPSIIEDAVSSGWITEEEGIQELALQGLNDVALGIYWNRFARKLAPPTSGAPGPGPGPGEGTIGRP